MVGSILSRPDICQADVCLPQPSRNLRARPGPMREIVMAHRDKWCRIVLNLVTQAGADGTSSGKSEPQQILHEILAQQFLANVAACLNDSDQFNRARGTVARILNSASG